MRVLLVPNTANPAAVSRCRRAGDVACRPRASSRVSPRDDAAECGLSDLGIAPSEIGGAGAHGGSGRRRDDSEGRASARRGRGAGAWSEVRAPRLPVGRGSGFHAPGGRDGAGGRGAARAHEPRSRAEVVMEGRSVGRYRALNEVVVSRGASARVVAFDVAVDGHRVFATRADGVIVATATGSTAYALSAGGPVVAPDFGGMVVVPVAPHTLAARSLVTGPADTVEITLPDPSRADACVVVDGESTPCRRAIERVTVARGDHDVLLVEARRARLLSDRRRGVLWRRAVIEELHVKNLALIEEVWLEFAGGMTVMSGETGAGKTALVGALKLLLGERADAGAVRAGQAEAVVEGRFIRNGRRRGASEAASRVRRSQPVHAGRPDGNGRRPCRAARPTGRICTASTSTRRCCRHPRTWSTSIAGWVMARHRRGADYRAARAGYGAAVRALAELEERLARVAQNVDYYRFVAEEIDRVDPVPGEYAALEARLPALQHGEQLIGGCRRRGRSTPRRRRGARRHRRGGCLARARQGRRPRARRACRTAR